MVDNLANSAPMLETILLEGVQPEFVFSISDIARHTVLVVMRDGIKLATEIYRPPIEKGPAVVARTPYGRNSPGLTTSFITLARMGYIGISQDCRGTGDSEPDSWDYYLYENQDGFDLVDWIHAQHWHDGFLGTIGASYVAQTQWCMATNSKVAAIAPEVGGLGVVRRTVSYYMFMNAHAISVGKGNDKIGVPFTEIEALILDETLAGGMFSLPIESPMPAALIKRYPQLLNMPRLEGRRYLWTKYCELSPPQRALFIKEALGDHPITATSMERLPELFGPNIVHDSMTIPAVTHPAVAREIRAPALMITGWYDWGLDDALATWSLLEGEGDPSVRIKNRLVITPSAHCTAGYTENVDHNSELLRTYNTSEINDLLLYWFETIKEGKIDRWPKIIYYLTGRNLWQSSEMWPPADSHTIDLYLQACGGLARDAPSLDEAFDTYRYDPMDPTPTIGGSIVSWVFKPGSVDVSEVQKRPDILVYETKPLDQGLEVVGNLSFVLFASTSAPDTDFSVRISDVWPDGRAVQLQSGIIRGRYRSEDREAERLNPDEIYRFDVNMWGIAHHFDVEHRLRIDISSADFPRFNRNPNTGEKGLPPIIAMQKVFRSQQHASHVKVPVRDAASN